MNQSGEEIRNNFLAVRRTNYVENQMVLPMFRWPFHIEPTSIWFKHDGPQDYLLSDLDSSTHFLLVTDHRTIGYFNPWSIYWLFWPLINILVILTPDQYIGYFDPWSIHWLFWPLINTLVILTPDQYIGYFDPWSIHWLFWPLINTLVILTPDQYIG